MGFWARFEIREGPLLEARERAIRECVAAMMRRDTSQALLQAERIRDLDARIAAVPERRQILQLILYALILAGLVADALWNLKP